MGSRNVVRCCDTHQVGQLYWVSVKSLFSISKHHIQAKVNNLKIIKSKLTDNEDYGPRLEGEWSCLHAPGTLQFISINIYDQINGVIITCGLFFISVDLVLQFVFCIASHSRICHSMSHLFCTCSNSGALNEYIYWQNRAGGSVVIDGADIDKDTVYGSFPGLVCLAIFFLIKNANRPYNFLINSPCCFEEYIDNNYCNITLQLRLIHFRSVFMYYLKWSYSIMKGVIQLNILFTSIHLESTSAHLIVRHWTNLNSCLLWKRRGK